MSVTPQAASMNVTPQAARQIVIDCQAELEQNTVILAQAVVRRAAAKLAYERAQLLERAKLVDAYSGQRMPAEDLRNALVFEQVDKSLYDEFVRKDAEVEVLKLKSRALADRMSGAQSVLSSLKDEWKGVGYGSA